MKDLLEDLEAADEAEMAQPPPLLARPGPIFSSASERLGLKVLL